MELIIVSPDYELNKIIAWIEINTPQGNYIIQKGHVPFIVSLSPHKPVTYQLESGKKETIVVQSGVAEINRANVMLIIRIGHTSNSHSL